MDQLNDAAASGVPGFATVRHGEVDQFPIAESNSDIRRYESCP